MAGTKIRHFQQLLDEGRTRDEAAEEAGVSSATAKLQYNKWKNKKPKVDLENNDE